MFDGSGSIDLDDDNTVRSGDYEQAWRRVHERLRAIARTRIALEAEEATHLLEAEDLGVFRRLGYVTMAEYLIRELGYTRHAANERMRVAHELESLPALAEEFADGNLCFSKVRECTNTQHLDVHHIVHREDGGSNELWNLCLLCFGHHTAHHDGLLEITGRAPYALVFRWVRDDDEPVPDGTDIPPWERFDPRPGLLRPLSEARAVPLVWSTSDHPHQTGREQA